MKVSVYKEEGGTMAVLLQASPGKGRPPVLMQGVAPEDVGTLIEPLIPQMRSPRPQQARALGPK